MNKVYVEVVAHFNKEGMITPKRVVWEDGRVYTIDEVMDVRRAASMKAGGTGMRYAIRIGNKESYLWFEEPAWFMERK